MSYGDLQQRIADEMEDDDILAGGQIAKAIQTAIKNYERQRFYFNTSHGDTFNTVAGQEYYGAADLAVIPNLVAIDWMVATYQGVRFEVFPVADQKIVSSQTGWIQGQPPKYFAYTNQMIRLYGIPTDAWPVTMGDVYRLPALSADADANAWTEDAEELIRQAAERILMTDVTHELPRGSGPTAAETLALNALKKETALRQANVQMRADDLTVLNRRGGRYDVYSDTQR